MNGKEFWLRWRGEILRGTVIFLVVVAGGFFVRTVVGRGREKLEGLREQFSTDFRAADRQRAEPWHWAGELAANRTLWLRNINGSIAVDSTNGPKLEIIAERTFKHSPVDSVRIVTAESEQGLTVCAVWPGRTVQCGPDGHYSNEGGIQGNDVALSFRVRLPAGIKLDASTVNGDVEVTGATAPVYAGTVNGDISIHTEYGPVRAATVNGDVAAVMHGFSGPGDVNVATVHGDASLTAPNNLDAVVEGHTVAGDISTDFPLVVSGKFASHAIEGTLGKGGRRLSLNTVTGDVELRSVGEGSDRRSPHPPTPPKMRPARTPQPR